MSVQFAQTSESTATTFVHDGSKTGSRQLSDSALEELLGKLVAVSITVEGICLPHNKLTNAAVYSIVGSMQRFSHLTHLDLSWNGIGYVGASAVAKACLEHRSVVRLNICGNNIGGKDSGVLMEYLFGPRSRLEFLDMSDNKLGTDGVQTLALWLPVNTCMVELRLENVGMTETGLAQCLNGLGNNSFLERLFLGRNTSISKLSPGRGLTDYVVTALFRNIALCHVDLPDLGSYFAQKVEFARSQNVALRKWLDSGYFCERLWSSIPMPLFARDTLCKLDLSNNLLVGLPYSILQLRSLEYLNIANNLIEAEAVPVHLRELPYLSTLRIDGNPFVFDIPERYDLNEIEDIFLFFDFFCESTLLGLHIKTVVLGAERAGKTRLVKTLCQAGPYDLLSMKRNRRRRSGTTTTSSSVTPVKASSAMLGDNSSLSGAASTSSSNLLSPSTSGGGGGGGGGGSEARGPRRLTKTEKDLASGLEGPSSQVNISKVLLPLPDRSTFLNLWDFSVPDIESHPMMQFYLSDGAFYLIVVNPSNSDWRESLVYWKSIIEGRVSSADVFFVVTHSDRPGNGAQKVAAEITRDFLPSAAASAPRKHRANKAAQSLVYHGVWTVSNSVKEVMPLLTKLALVADPRVKLLGRVPVPWSAMESMLAEEQKAMSFPIMSFSRFEDMALACGALDDEISRIARYLHECGTIIHYSDISKKLSNVVVLSPPWLLKVASRLLAFGGSDGTPGTFRVEDIPMIWQAYEFPPRSHQPIVQLLEAFEVLNPLGRVFVMPFLIPDKAPREEEWPLNRVAMAQRYTRVYTFAAESIPRTLMAQLIIRLLEISTVAFSIWQTGVIFSVKERNFLHMIAIRLIRAENELMIDVSSNDKESGKILHILHSTIESVLDGWFKNLQYQAFAIGADGARVSLDELAKLSMQMKHKINVAISEDIAPDILMKSTYRVNMNDVEEGEFIAAGAFGSVSSGRYKGQEIVVKRMLTLEQISQPEMYSSFLKECWAMSFLNHDCIIHMVGISLEPLCMVIEFMNLRDLRHFLDHFCLPPWSLRLKILMDVSRGMAYAHEQFPSIVHRDLKSPNVFLSLSADGLLSAKVADLGLATVLPKLVKNAVVENPTWSAPEVCLREPYSQPADVYSFGIVMWEVMTGQFPFGDLWNQTQFTTEIVAEIVKGTRPTLPSETTGIPPGFIDLVKSAWAQAEEDRPSFNQLCQGLAVISRSYADAQASSSLVSSSGSVAADPPLSGSSSSASSVGNASASSCKTAIKTLFRLPRIWGGVATIAGGALLFTIRADVEFDATDLRTDSITTFRHVSPNFSLRGAQLLEVSATTVWAVDDARNEILVLEASGRSSVVACPEVQKLSSIVLVNDHVWSSGLEVLDAGQDARTCIFVWSIERMTKRLMAKVKGELRHGITASNMSVYFACTRSNGQKNFLWRMRVADKKSFKLRLPSAGVCLIDVHSRGEIWVVCSGANCIVRASYDLKEMGRFPVGPNVFRTGVFLERHNCVASIGAASLCLWNCDTLQPFSIRSIASTLGGSITARPMARDVPPVLLNASQFGELVAVTGEQTVLMLIENPTPVPFVPEARKVEEERKVSRVEKREKATRTVIQKFENTRSRSLSSTESSESDKQLVVDPRYSFAHARYTGDSRPMGLGDALKMSSVEDLFSEDVLSKVQAKRDVRAKMQRSRERSQSDPSDEPAVIGNSLSNLPVVQGRTRSHSSVSSETPLLNISVTSPRRRRNSFSEKKSSSGALPGSSGASSRSSPAKTPGISPRVTSPLGVSPRMSPRRSVSSAVLNSQSVGNAAGAGGGGGGAGGGSGGGLESGPSGAGEALRQKRASLLRRNESVVVERSALLGKSSSKLFAYEKRSIEMSPFEAHLSAGRSPPGEGLSTSPNDPPPASLLAAPVEFVQERKSGSRKLSRGSGSEKLGRGSGSEKLGRGSASPSVDVSPIGSPDSGGSRGSSQSDASAWRKSSGHRDDSGVLLVSLTSSSSMDARSSPSPPPVASVSKKNSAGPVGLVGLVDESTLEKLYPNDSKVARRNSAVQKKLQRVEPVQRRMQSSVNIGGVSMKVTASPASASPTVPKLNIAEARRGGMFKKKRSDAANSEDTNSSSPSPSPFGSFNDGRISPPPSAGRSNTASTSPKRPASPSKSPPTVPPIVLVHQTRSRSNTATAAPGEEGAARKGHTRTRSMGQTTEDPEVKEIRDLLNVRLGNGLQVMKGRSGSVSGPNTIRGVPKSQQHMRRVLQGEAGMMSPPSSDEHRDSDEVIPRHGRSASPLVSPSRSGGNNNNAPPEPGPGPTLIGARELERIYSRTAKADQPSSHVQLSPTRGEPPADAPKRASKLPRAFTKISELFRPSRSSESGQASSAPAASGGGGGGASGGGGGAAAIAESPKGGGGGTGAGVSGGTVYTELNTKIERRGSLAGPALSDALMRVSKQAERQSDFANSGGSSSSSSLTSNDRRKSLGLEFDEETKL